MKFNLIVFVTTLIKIVCDTSKTAKLLVLGSPCVGVDKRKEKGNILFNDALNTYYLRLYGVGHMVKDHSDSQRGKVKFVLFNDATGTH